jgi:pyridoxine 4-dehydrogenase
MTLTRRDHADGPIPRSSGLMTSSLRKFSIGGTLPVNRIGFGAMRLTDWRGSANRVEALRVARRAVELGVTLIDTADAYALGANEELLADALHPYADDLVIATKAGQSRPSSSEWKPLGRPEYLRQQAELSLRRLRIERIELFQLHRVDPDVPFCEQLGALKQLQDEGKVRFVGLSEVNVEQLDEARTIIEVASVQNLYNLHDRRHEAVVDYCTRHEIAFIPWLPIAGGAKGEHGSALATTARETGASAAQVALAWLLHRSSVIVPIPGTRSVAHLEENIAASCLELSDAQLTRLNGDGDDSEHAGTARSDLTA